MTSSNGRAAVGSGFGVAAAPVTPPAPGAEAAAAATGAPATGAAAGTAATAFAVADPNLGAGAEAIAPGAGEATGGVTTAAGGATEPHPATKALAIRPWYSVRLPNFTGEEFNVMVWSI